MQGRAIYSTDAYTGYRLVSPTSRNHKQTESSWVIPVWPVEEDENMKAIRNVTLLSLSLVALALLAVAPAAYADSIPYTGYVTLQTTDLTNVAVLPAIPQFNSSLGTLTSVTITVEASGVTDFVSLTNMSSSATQFVASEDTGVWLNDLNNSTIDTNLLGPTSSSAADLYTTTPGSYTYNIHGAINGETGGTNLAKYPGPGNSTSEGPYYPTDTESVSTTNPTYLAQFVGGGDLDLVVSTKSAGGYFATGGANIDTVETNEAGAEVKVTYDYTPRNTPPVPEPGTLTLFGTGLLGLAGLLRRKFMQSR